MESHASSKVHVLNGGSLLSSSAIRRADLVVPKGRVADTDGADERKAPVVNNDAAAPLAAVERAPLLAPRDCLAMEDVNAATFEDPQNAIATIVADGTISFMAAELDVYYFMGKIR